jgi:hypothetical protein
MKRPRQFSLVKLAPNQSQGGATAGQTFRDDLPLVFLGEIPNMPEHGVFVGHRSGRIYSGLHIFQFVELADEEV